MRAAVNLPSSSLLAINNTVAPASGGPENPRGGEAGANVRFAASGGNIGTTRATPIYAKRFTRSGPDVNDDTAGSRIRFRTSVDSVPERPARHRLPP